MTVGAFVGAAALIGISFYWFNPSGTGDCSFNVSIIVFTIALTVAVSLLSMHPQASHLWTIIVLSYHLRSSTSSCGNAVLTIATGL